MFPDPCVPDHQLIYTIGAGSYGTVWLARNIMGVHRAVKVVYRARFDDDRPYDREFRGIQQFEPISRSHESQVDILHVGRNDTDGYFYYVMELADPVDLEGGPMVGEGTISQSGQPALASCYIPRTLKSELSRSALGRLPVSECLEIALALTNALGHLHSKGLVHRDVKPSNIIFVNGIPKLADIGLVTGVDATLSQVGTEGFAAPEGTGTPQSDIYSLGKVLYEISTGKDRQAFPEPLTEIGSCPDQDQLLELDEIISRACAHDPKQRYPSAQAMQEDLLLLQAGHSVKRLHRLQRQLAKATRAVAVVACLGVLLGAGWFYAAQKEQQATLAREESEQSRRAETTARLATEQALAESRINLARAVIETRASGQRFHALELVQQSARRTNTAELRTLALRALSLPDASAWKSIPHPSRPSRIAFDRELKLYATNDISGDFLIRSVDTDETVYSLAPPTLAGGQVPTAVHCAFSELGQSLNVLYLGGYFTAWSLTNSTKWSTPTRRFQVNTSAYQFSLSPDGTKALFLHKAGADYHEIKTGRRDYSIEANVGHAAFSAVGDMFLEASGPAVLIFDSSSGQLLAQFRPTKTFTAAIWLSDGYHIAVAERRGDGQVDDCDIHIWNVLTRQLRNSFRAHLQFISALGETPGRLLVSTGWDRRACFWDAGSGEKLLELDWNAVTAIVNATGDRLAWKDDAQPLWHVWRGNVAPELARLRIDPALWVTDLSPLGLLAKHPENGQAEFWPANFGFGQSKLPEGVKHVRFAPDLSATWALGRAADGGGLWIRSPLRVDTSNSVLFSGPPQLFPLQGTNHDWFKISADGLHAVARHQAGFQIIHWGEPPVVVSPVSDRPTDFTISRDGKLVVTSHRTGGIRGPLHLWDGPTGRLVRKLDGTEGNTLPRLSSDGRWLLTKAVKQGFRVYEAREWKLRYELSSGSRPYHAGEFSRDGRMVALANSDRHIRLLETDQWTELATISAPLLVKDFFFSTDDSQLLASSESGQVEIWDLRLIRTRLAGMNLDFPLPPLPLPRYPDRTPLKIVPLHSQVPPIQ